MHRNFRKYINKVGRYNQKLKEENYKVAIG